MKEKRGKRVLPPLRPPAEGRGKDKVILIIILTVISVCVLPWLDEILDLPHLLMDAPRTPINWDEALIESCLIALVSLLALKILGISRKHRRQAEMELQEERDKARGYLLLTETVLNAVPHAIIGLEERRVTFANRAVETVFGWKPEELIGQSTRLLYRSEKDYVKIGENFYGRLEREETHTEEFPCRRKNGEVIICLVSTSRIGGNLVKKKIVATYTDITELKKAQEEALAREKRMRHLQKMESVGQMAGGMAHDFNNLLAVIQSLSELAVVKLEKGKDVARQLAEIKATVKRGTSLTRQLLAFSRKQVLQPKILDLNQLISGIVKMIKSLTGGNIQITTHFSPEPLWIKADASQLEQVIINLAINARDAMPDGGVIKIKSEKVSLKKSDAERLGGAYPGVFATLSFEDSGSGIAPKTLPYIFDPFFSTKQEGQGTGLGLSTVYGIVKQHEGWINVSSSVGQGTEFRIYFPFLHPPEEELSPRTKEKGKEVLLVGDQEDTLAWLSSLLKQEGYAVTTVATAADAIRTFARKEGKFNLLISQVSLSDRSGIGLFQELQEKEPNLNFILTSATEAVKRRADLFREKGFQFLAAPYRVGELLKILAGIPPFTKRDK